MKKLIIIIICIACTSLCAIAQQSTSNFTIANRDITIIVHERDTASRSADPYRYHRTAVTIGFGFIVPDNNHYLTLGGNSINFNVGGMYKCNLARRFAVGATAHYSFYNYRLRNANEEQSFNTAVLGDRTIARSDINKQVFRSHSISPGIFARYYLKPSANTLRNDGMYIDLGLQGDLAFSKYYILKHPSGEKDKYRNNDVFNTLGASAVARFGWMPQRWSGNSNSSFALYFRYRLTNVFNQKLLPMDLPKFTIGIIFIDTKRPHNARCRCC